MSVSWVVNEVLFTDTGSLEGPPIYRWSLEACETLADLLRAAESYLVGVGVNQSGKRGYIVKREAADRKVTR